MLRNKYFSVLSIIGVLLFISVSYGQGIKATFTPSSRLFAGFGNVVVGKSKDQTIRIYNDSTSSGVLTCSIIIAQGTVFSVSGPASFSLSPGQSDTLTVHFQPTAFSLVRDTISITHNADTTATLKNPVLYSLSGIGILPDTFPKISVTSAGGFGTFISYGSVTVGKTASRTFTIKNVSDTIRKLIGTITTPTSSRFSIISGGGPFALDTGMYETVTVNFSPDTAAQFLTDSVIINSNAASPNNRIKVTLFGTGLKPTNFPRISIGGVFGTINFRTDTIGHPPRTASFSVTNTSDSIRTLTGNISSPNSPFSIISGGGNFTLDSGKLITVQLAFAATSIGTFNDTITITSNTDPVNPPIKIPLVGLGFAVTGPHITVQPTVLNFGTNKLGAALTTFMIKIRNNADSLKDTLIGTVSSPNMPFTLTSGGGAFSLLSNDSQSIVVQMTTDKAGTFQDSIVIISNSNDNAKRVVVRLSGIVTAQGAVYNGKPESLNFITAMPNPFTGKTAICFSVDAPSPASLKIYDLLGKEIFVSSEHIYPSGVGQIEWNASGLEDGAYLCVLAIGKETRSIKVILRK